MIVEDYINNYDKDFDVDTFIAKINNIVIKYFNSITLNEMKKIDHFVSDKVYAMGEKLVQEADKNGNIQMFDEFNIRKSRINKIEVDNEAVYIYVDMNLLYMDYLINKASGIVVKGDNHTRVVHPMTMVFKKYKHAKEQVYVKTCPNCGASLNPNNTGICEYCHSVYDQEDHDWYLEDIIGFNK